MHIEEAKKLITNTFQQSFDENHFRLFIRNLFNDLDESGATPYYQGQYIPEAYRKHIRRYKRLGKYIDPEGAALDVLVVNLKRDTALDRARTMQRNFIAWYLKHRGEKDAAIVAYHTDGLEDWRFSYVHMEYRAEQEKSGKVRIKTDLTPARRYSFLVGANEPNHTAQQQLLPLIQDDRNNPTLAELEKAFTIESVTREFFERYKELFLKLKEELDALVEGDRRIAVDFSAKDIRTEDFTKKLLGQIVFLYFLQKKGWLGVGKDKEGNFNDWGSGPKDFLQRLYRREIVPYENFFNDLLEPLFYEALATDRGEESYYSRFRCKIPFLNGGLFEPVGGYNWQEVDILIHNETFGEIFDTFDLYNFTVREDEPLEKEVAVDPEMLGKVFENLLEIRDRKSKGAYYTPRQIVHYMCQESLIHYLDSALNNSAAGYERLGLPQIELFGPGELAKPDGRMELMVKYAQQSIPRDDISFFIRQGQFGIENDLKVDEKGRETSTYSWKLPKSIRNHAERIDQALADIKICDPAIGSGAFPVGMLHEIVRAREILSTYLPDNPDRTSYNFKRHAIQESIYGVDIDCGAVDIAKLRLWLSLVVDEDDFRTIKPLPNLDYKIVCGNSLTQVERDLLNDHLFAELETLKQRFFNEINPRQKKEEKAGIESLIRKLTHNDKHFDYAVYFSEIFHAQPGDNGRRSPGFDVVIANPPYVRQETIKFLKPQLKQTFGKFYCGTADLYTYFYKRGLDLLKDGGHLCFIAPNKFMRAGYGKNTRTLLTGHATPKIVIDFGDLPIFDATTYPSIILVEKSKPEDDVETLAATFREATQLENPEETLTVIGFEMPISALKPEGWTLERPEVLALMEKLRKAGKPLGEYVEGRFYRGVLTGLNEAFVINEATRKRLIAEDPRSAELIQPWLRGRDIRKWKTEWAGLYVIFTRRGTDIDQYPAIKHHLGQFRKDLEPKKSDKDKRGRKPGSYKWFEIQDNIAYFEEFEKPKIIYPNITKTNIFAYDTTSILTNQKCFIIPTTDIYLVAILNSKLATQWFHSTLPLLRGGFFEPSAIFMQHFPIFLATDTQKSLIIERVRKIIADPDSPSVLQIEEEINRVIYELYGLTEQEIEIVEGKSSSSIEVCNGKA